MGESVDEISIELPMTGAVSDCIFNIALGHALKAALPVAFGLFVTVGMGARLLQGTVDAATVTLTIMGIGLTFVVPYGLWHRTRDMRSTSYLQRSGPFRYGGEEHDEDDTWYCMTVAGEHVLIDEYIGDRAVKDDLAALSDATVAFTKHRRTVIEIRDADGRVCYRHSKYRPL